jgi:large subunit ribosomal protein L1
MTRQTKRFREIAKHYSSEKSYTIAEAIDILKLCPAVKFDQSVELAVKTGIDPSKSDQQVRGTVSLPNGTGKKIVLVVFARGEKINEALDAGADFAGNDDLIEKIKNGWMDFNAVVSTPDMMREVGKLGKVLGPRGLMPTPKGGSVTTDVAKAVTEVKAGKIEFKTDKSAVINNMIGKLSFDKSKLLQNLSVYLSALAKSRPATAKGQFIRSLSLSSTMGPGLKIDMQTVTELQG